MRLVTFRQSNTTRVGVQSGNEIHAVESDGTAPASMLELIRFREECDDWSTFEQRLESHLSSVAVDVSDAHLEAPVCNPDKIICIGKNYADHAREMGAEPPGIPVVFSKFNTAIAHPEAEIRLPSISSKVDYEAELVVVIGKRGREIAQHDAMQHVFGYCCGNDISARDWQKEKPGGQWLLGKTFDGFAPLGPTIVTADQIDNPHSLDIRLLKNGTERQNSNTAHMIFPIDFLIAHLSRFVTLMPGDLIFTGTPSGVGAGLKPPEFLTGGDVLVVEIEGLGALRNTVV